MHRTNVPTVQWSTRRGAALFTLSFEGLHPSYLGLKRGILCFFGFLPVAARYFPKYSSASRNNHNASMKCQ